MTKFTPPKIVKDEEVEEPPPEQEELKETKIDVVNQEGIKDEGIVTPAVIDEGKQELSKKRKKTRTRYLKKLKSKLLSQVVKVPGENTLKET